MFLVSSNSSLLLLLSVFLFSSTLGPHKTAARFHDSQFARANLLGGAKDEVGNMEFSLGGRSLVEGYEHNKTANYTFVLAKDRTHRKDPMNNFQFYTGGWDLRNKSYIHSVAYTTAPALLAGIIWFVGFGVALLVYCCCCCFCGRKRNSSKGVAYVLSLFLVIALAIAAIIGCTILYCGQGGFNTSVRHTLSYIQEKATEIMIKLTSLGQQLMSVKELNLGSFGIPEDIVYTIDRADKLINETADLPKKTSDKFSHVTNQFLRTIGLFFITVTTVMLVFTLLGFCLSLLGLRPLLCIMFLLGWILVTCTFILCSTSILIHNVVADSCVAVDDWLQHPADHTAMDDVLPCYDTANAGSLMESSKNVTHEIVGIMCNNFITSIANYHGNLYNQSGPNVPLVCDPNTANDPDQGCDPGEVSLKNAAEEWKKYVCEVNEQGECKTQGRLLPEDYKRMAAAVNVTDALNELIPFVSQLMNCSTIRSTLQDISTDHCPDLKLYSYRTYVGLLIVSVSVMLSIITWMF